jgi:hypothetical protein
LKKAVQTRKSSFTSEFLIKLEQRGEFQRKKCEARQKEIPDWDFDIKWISEIFNCLENFTNIIVKNITTKGGETEKSVLFILNWLSLRSKIQVLNSLPTKLVMYFATGHQIFY